MGAAHGASKLPGNEASTLQRSGTEDSSPVAWPRRGLTGPAALQQLLGNGAERACGRRNPQCRRGRAAEKSVHWQRIPSASCADSILFHFFPLSPPSPSITSSACAHRLCSAPQSPSRQFCVAGQRDQLVRKLENATRLLLAEVALPCHCDFCLWSSPFSPGSGTHG